MGSRAGGAWPDMLLRLSGFFDKHRAAERRRKRPSHNCGSGPFPPRLRSASWGTGVGWPLPPASPPRFEKTQPRIRDSAAGVVVAAIGTRRIQGMEHHPRAMVSVGWAGSYRVPWCDRALLDPPRKQMGTLPVRADSSIRERAGRTSHLRMKRTPKANTSTSVLRLRAGYRLLGGTMS